MEPWEQGTRGSQGLQCQVDKGHLGKVSEELLGLALKGWDCGGEWTASSKITHRVGLGGWLNGGHSHSV